MGFFNDLSKKTSETTSKIAKETKLRLKINENKSKISDLYEEIGKIVYEKHLKEENINIKEEIVQECKKIDNLAQEIENARTEILKLNQKKQCKLCNCQINDADKYCPQCGKKQDNIEPTIFEEAKEKLSMVEIEPENEEKAEIVKEELEEKIEEDE